MPYGSDRYPYTMARRPSLSFIMLEGLPCEPPVDSAGRLMSFQLLPLSSLSHPSTQCVFPSLQRRVDRIFVGDSRTEEGMIENPFGSGPIQLMNSQVLPP